MKITFLALLFPLFCFSQMEKTTIANVTDQVNIPSTSFLLKDKKIIYQKIFSSNLPKEELYNKVNTMLSTLRGFKFDLNVYSSDGEFYGKLFQHRFDYHNYDTGLFSGAALAYPIFATVAVQLKDGKYRVTISEIVFRQLGVTPQQDVNFMLEDLLTQRNRGRITKSKNYLKLATYLDQDFSDLFDLNKSIIASDF